MNTIEDVKRTVEAYSRFPAGCQMYLADNEYLSSRLVAAKHHGLKALDEAGVAYRIASDGRVYKV